MDIHFFHISDHISSSILFHGHININMIHQIYVDMILNGFQFEIISRCSILEIALKEHKRKWSCLFASISKTYKTIASK